MDKILDSVNKVYKEEHPSFYVNINQKNLNKIIKARKNLERLTSFLFKMFQVKLRYREKRPDYGIEIFEYFYLPWRTDKTFKEAHTKISDYTLNPKSRLYTIYDFAKNYLTENTSNIK